MHPAHCSLSSSTTGNEVMAQIFNECEKYGFEILNDGIYHNDVKLGEVGCTDGGWWVMRTGEFQHNSQFAIGVSACSNPQIIQLSYWNLAYFNCELRICNCELLCLVVVDG